MKTCKKCNQLKSLENYELSYSSKNPENRRYECKSCRNIRRKEFGTRSGNGLREYNIKRLYGITPQQYKEMILKQDNKCAICQKINTFGPWNNKLVIDHCHKTGKVRSLLYDKCNRGLGQFNDNPELLIEAIKYLKHHTKV